MSTSIRTTFALPAAPAPGIYVFAGLSFIESIARALVVTIMALQSYELLGSAQGVGTLSVFVGLFSFGAGLAVPLIIRKLSRRWTYTLGALSLIIAAALLLAFTVPAQIAGVCIRGFGTACLNITANLYFMDYIGRHRLVRADAMRMVGATTGWTAGPWLGVYLAETYAPAVTYTASAVFAAVLILVFWYLRLKDRTVILPAGRAPDDPRRSIAGFLAQPRLRLAWIIAFGRSAYWTTLFTYGPILLLVAGLSREAGGVLVSLANATLLTAVLWAFLAERRGVRPATTLCFVGMGATTMLAGMYGSAEPLAAAAFLLAASVFASGLDAFGSVPFYRAVKPRQRAAMSGVYRSYMDFGDLLPNLVYVALLGFFGIGSVFLALGLFHLAIAILAWRFLPRSM